MDRNTITGLLLMMALLFGYQWYIAPTAKKSPRGKPNRKPRPPLKTAWPKPNKPRPDAELATMEALQNGTTLDEGRLGRRR